MKTAGEPLQQQRQRQQQRPEPPPFPVKNGFLTGERKGQKDTVKATPAKPRCRKVAARCRVAGCGGRPWFAQPGALVPKACKNHKEEGEVNIYTPTCEADGCRTRPHYGMEGGRARFCSTHRLSGMVDVLNRRCSAGGCRRQPSWAWKKGERALFCKEHKEDGMVDTKHRTCLHPGCTRFPSKSAAAAAAGVVATAREHLNDGGSNGISAEAPLSTADSPPPARAAVPDGDTPTTPSPSAAAASESGAPARAATTTGATGAARYCALHAPAGAVNVTAGRCRHPGGCPVQPCFGYEGAGQPAEFCARHRKKGMTDVRNPRCSKRGCTAQPCCGNKGDPRPRFCLRHAEPDMINFRSEVYSEKETTSRKRRRVAGGEPPTARFLSISLYAAGMVVLGVILAGLGGKTSLNDTGVVQALYLVMLPSAMFCVFMIAKFWVESLPSQLIPAESFAMKLRDASEHKDIFVVLGCLNAGGISTLGVATFFVPAWPQLIADVAALFGVFVAVVAILFVAVQITQCINEAKAKANTSGIHFYENARRNLWRQALILNGVGVIAFVSILVKRLTVVGRDEIELSEPARLLLLASLLAKDGLISHNGKGFLKDLILRRDEELLKTFAGFGSNTNFLQDLHGLIDRQSRRLFDSLFAGLSLSEGKSLSKAERRRKGLMNDRALIYGEVDFSNFATILREVAAMRGSKPGEIFYDLGSGTGKAVYVARLTQDYTHCVGIEILRPLHSAAQLVTNRYNAHVRGLLDRGRPQNAAVFMGSFLEYDWSDGDCVFANSTCFPEELMDALARQAEELKPGAILVTFTKGLDSTAFEVLSKRRFDMSWGPATVFIHRRCNGSGRPRRKSTRRAPVPVAEAARLETGSVPSGSNNNSSVGGSSNDGGSNSNSSGSGSSIGSGGSSGASIRGRSEEPNIIPIGSAGPNGVAAGGLFGGGSDGGSSGGFGGGVAAVRRMEGKADGSAADGSALDIVGRRGAAGEGLEGAGEVGDDDGKPDGGSNVENNEERGGEGSCGSSDEDRDRGYMFDTERLQDGTMAGDDGDGVASRANSERFMGFGEMLRQAEQARAQSLEQVNLSREELLAMPDELIQTALVDSDNRDGTDDDDDDDDDDEEEEEEEDLDELHDLSDGGTVGSVHSEAGEQDHEARGDGQAEPDTEDQTTPPTDLGGEGPRGGGEGGSGRAERVGGTGRGSAVVPVARAVGAVAADDAEIEPEFESSSEHHGMEFSAATTPGETNKEQRGQPLPGDQEQRCTLGNEEAAAAAAAVVPTGVNDAPETVEEGGESGEGACHDLALNGGSDAPAGEDGPGDGDAEANGGTGTDGVQGAHNTEAVPDGNPDESVEAIPEDPGDRPTGSLPPPPPLGVGNDAADAKTASNGAAAAMQCLWLPVKLPPPPSSKGGGSIAHEPIEPSSPVLQVRGMGVDPPPVVDGEALESPQDAALLKRKAYRDPSGK
eukprot:g11351.t1